MDKMMKPICPHCNTEMKRIKYAGYYESFVYWECACDDKDIKIDDEYRGAYA